MEASIGEGCFFRFGVVRLESEQERSLSLVDKWLQAGGIISIESSLNLSA